VERSLRQDERDVLRHLLSGSDPLSVALRPRIDEAWVQQDRVCCASVHIYAGEEELQELTGGQARRVEANWPGPPRRVVRLVIAGSGSFSHLELTHDGEETGPMTFPPPDELGDPVWSERVREYVLVRRSADGTSSKLGTLRTPKAYEAGDFLNIPHGGDPSPVPGRTKGNVWRVVAVEEPNVLMVEYVKAEG
jgi:hypothetical protein